jgi:hypothetical protein
MEFLHIKREHTGGYEKKSFLVAYRNVRMWMSRLEPPTKAQKKSYHTQLRAHVTMRT